MNNVTEIADVTGQSISYATQNQSGLSTAVGAVATTVSYVEGVARQQVMLSQESKMQENLQVEVI